MARTWLATLILLLLLAPGAAAEREVADLTTHSLLAEGATVEGNLAGLESLAETGAIELSAAEVSLVFEQESSAGAGNQSPMNYTEEPPQRHSHQDVEGGQASLREDSQVYVLPLPGKTAVVRAPASPCTALADSDRDAVTPVVNIRESRERHGETADVRPSAEWSDGDCPVSAWTIEGSFFLTLWETDLAFGHADGQASYSTGASVRYTAPLGLTHERTNRQLFVEVRDGKLTLQAGGAAVFLAGAAIQADRLVFRDAAGTVASIPDAALGSDLELRGRLRADVEPHDGDLAVRVTGQLDGGAVGGRSVAVDPSTPFGPSAWLFGLLALPVAVAGTAAWRRRPMAALARLERLAEAGRHDEVAARSRRLQKVRGLSAEATALRVEALARTGRLGEALADARSLPPLESSLAQAYAYAITGDGHACVAALRSCAELDAGWARAALRDPAFSAVRSDPALARLAEGRP